jgi:hypothetical protein
MKWLPSFVTLFLVFVAGLVLQVIGIGGLASVGPLPNSTGSEVFTYVRLLGLLLMFVSPLLIALKFFSRLDKKA